jgi:hypothetical protein
MLRGHQGKSKFQVYDQEIAEVQDELKSQTVNLEAYIEELERLGVILRSAHDGIIDFPTVIEDQPAFYSWQMEEPDITDFHWAHESSAERRPLASLDTE